MNILHDPANRMSANVTSMEIDDDDEDVIQVAVEVSNEAAMPIGGLDIFIKPVTTRKSSQVRGLAP